MFTKILTYDVYNESRENFMQYIKKFNKIHIISGNPEVLNSGLNNEMLFKNFTQKNSVIIPDGIGTVIASKIVGNKVEEKIAGIEVMEEIIKLCEKEEKGIYLLGTKEETLNKCINNLKIKYPKLKILGSHNGFFDLDNCYEIISEINKLNPYALFVAMGAPRQEIFISKYMDSISATIFMGVGGSFDVMAGEVKRAPKWMISMGLEWLYRVGKEPWRIKRLSSIPKFLVKVIQNR
ncbi:putative N-acetylmannosaminyltransferase [Clostridium liquoris]|jgi:N-acetylglucosaminyldiphosphoundecaprenol N-acetyl-beta-D-mannosaminyltransferase|uniref:N-acetylglucosaminyldiphosphoundecaprenol N-acetyl-beta-D-mannosaminyltransferase n=1 Tax=Clostridium liquoris TaxID=1289519 RepID=A0A2T0AZV9_9CLOT|nr:WecB/TagA/CpsF family glycosyltransferase [Clostridium liquoris]PRR76802.1 putative N-acetylmannosaminyltransferase [Clostridium liquoris]